MGLPAVVSKADWLTARQELLVREKQATRARDELNAARRRLPMVLIDKDYVFEGPDGKASLVGLFEGRRQLVIYHFMFGPDWDTGCPSCTNFSGQVGSLESLNATQTTFAAVSRAPLAKITPYKQRMGWTFPWYSSYGSDFNYDFHVTLDGSVAPIEYNYRTRAQQEKEGSPRARYFDGEQPIELPGLSCFLRDDDRVFHTYSTYGRGTDNIGFAVNVLDLTALGRQQDWEEPKGRSDGIGRAADSPQIRYHDEYDD
jgi:predicted dithiol-disulfide oxidoreductase (DUF899 family)